MADLIFKTSLSDEEIEKNFEDINFFDGIMEGLNEALAYEKGKASAQTFARKQALPKIDVSGLRKSLDMTQNKFASVLGVSPRTVEAWETGKSNPTPTAKKLMYLIYDNNSIVDKLL